MSTVYTMKKPQLILVHGLFMHGSLMQYMAFQLKKCGYEVHVFSYKSVGKPLQNNAEQLIEFVKTHIDEGAVCHFVGHSLGGLLIRLAYAQAPTLFTGRIVTLGTPHNGSLVARRVANDLHRAILGGAYENALDGDLPPWQGNIELGSIAGTKCLGIGMALPALEKPNDGTVSAAETQLSQQTDSTTLPLSHTALIYSSRAVAQVDAFLREGRFLTT